MELGFANLKNAKDLFGKLKFEIEALREDPQNAYTVYNFFVTAFHLSDWFTHGNSTSTKEFCDDNAILRICRHIANGCKHYHLTNVTQNNSVINAENTNYVEPGYMENGYYESPIEITLKNDHAEALNIENPVPVLELAELAFDFWQEKFQD